MNIEILWLLWILLASLLGVRLRNFVMDGPSHCRHSVVLNKSRAQNVGTGCGLLTKLQSSIRPLR